MREDPLLYFVFYLDHVQGDALIESTYQTLIAINLLDHPHRWSVLFWVHKQIITSSYQSRHWGTTLVDLAYASSPYRMGTKSSKPRCRRLQRYQNQPSCATSAMGSHVWTPPWRSWRRRNHSHGRCWLPFRIELFCFCTTKPTPRPE